MTTHPTIEAAAQAIFNERAYSDRIRDETLALDAARAILSAEPSDAECQECAIAFAAAMEPDIAMEQIRRRFKTSEEKCPKEHADGMGVMRAAIKAAYAQRLKEMTEKEPKP